MANITIYQTPMFGQITGHLPVFTMNDFPAEYDEDMFTLGWLFNALNDHEKMETYGCPSTMRSLSVGDIVCITHGLFEPKYYALTAIGWAKTVAPR